MREFERKFKLISRMIRSRKLEEEESQDKQIGDGVVIKIISLVLVMF